MTRRSIEDPFEHLMEEHREVENLFRKLEDTTERATHARDELFARLRAALTSHAEQEERALYPALKHIEETHDLTFEAVEEHGVVKVLLEELRSGDSGTDTWTAKLTVLKESVEHHVKEEEGELFKKAKKALSEERLGRIARDMEEILASAR